MYKVKPFESFDLSDIKLPDTMYRMAPVYGNSFVTPATKKQQQISSIGKQQDGDHKSANTNQTSSLDEQTERLSNLNLSSNQFEPIELIVHLSIKSPLLDYLATLKSDNLKTGLRIDIFKHCSLSNNQQTQDEQLIEQWYSLTKNDNSTTPPQFSLKIILKSSDFNQACLFKSDSNFKLNGEIKILALLNHLIDSSMSVQVNDLNGLVHKLLLDEYLDYLQQSLNNHQVDQQKLDYYRTNLQKIKSKVLDIAELIFKNEFKN